MEVVSFTPARYELLAGGVVLVFVLVALCILCFTYEVGKEAGRRRFVKSRELFDQTMMDVIRNHKKESDALRARIKELESGTRLARNTLESYDFD